jgi:hypothetical protein
VNEDEESDIVKSFLLGKIPWMRLLGMRFEISRASICITYIGNVFLLCTTQSESSIGLVKMGNATGTKANLTFDTFSNISLTGIIVNSSGSVCL